MPDNRLQAGIDVGSINPKVIVLDREDGSIAASLVQPTGHRPREASKMAYAACLERAGRPGRVGPVSSSGTTCVT